MVRIYRCPKCDARFDPPRAERSECPQCGLWFHKWAHEPATAAEPPATDTADAADIPPTSAPAVFWGRALLLALLLLWSVDLARRDFRGGEFFQSFMHMTLLPFHEAGHVLLMPFGEFMTILGGSLFQVALPLAIGAAFLFRQRDAFGAAVCLWWAGASVVDLAPYVWDALHPQLMLLGGHTGEDGPHDWIYLLDRVGARQHAHALGRITHHLGVLLMGAGLLWGAAGAWARRPFR